MLFFQFAGVFSFNVGVSASEMGGKSKKKNGVQAANGKPKNVEFKGLNDIKESHANGM